MDSSATSASLWNRGNWHWESTSFARNAEQEIRSRLLSIELEGRGVVVRVVQVLKLSAEAALHVRRGKRVATFDVSFTVRWEGWRAGGPRPDTTPSGKHAAGEVAVVDVMQDDVASDFAVPVYMSSVSGHNDVDVWSKEVAKAGLPVAVRAQLRAFCEQLSARAAEADAAAVEKVTRGEDARRTALALADTTAVAERERLTGLQAASLAVLETSEKARAAAEGAAAVRPPVLTPPVSAVLSLPVPLKVEAAGVAPDVRPSEWNVGAWSWESRDMSSWAHTKLTEVLSNVEFDVPAQGARPGAFLRTIQPESLNVEASACIRKAKKMVLYDLSLDLPWEGSLIGPDGAVLGNGHGLVKVKDFDQDSLTEGGCTFVATADEEGGAQDAVLTEVMREHGLPLLRARLHAFAVALSAQALQVHGGGKA